MKILLVGLFGLLLWMPLLDLFFSFLPKSENTEKRQLSPKPKLQWGTLNDFPKNYERYFNDHFGGRNPLVGLNNFIHVKLFNVSPLKSVLVGKEGWLFYTLDKSLNDYRGLVPFSQDQLEKIRQNIQKQTAWLRSKGIPYLILLCPNKQTIYPEYLPDGIRRVNRKTRLDQILDTLRPDEKKTIIDVRKELTAAKKDRLVYFITDTHWNDYGAFIAYQEVLKELVKSFPFLSPLTISNFTLSVHPNKGLGDLAVMLSLNGRLDDSRVQLVLKSGSPLQGRKIPKAVILHDSFVSPLKTYLDYHFDETVMRHWEEHAFNYALIEQEKPDVVILEIAERCSYALLP